MRKLTLNLEALSVESFETMDAETGRGTVRGFEPTKGGPNKCGDTSIADACETGLCTPVTCPFTYDAVECPSIVDACPSARGCTEIDCV